MIKTGDLNKNVNLLQLLLKKINFNHNISNSELSTGDPRVYLPIINYSLLEYSSYIATLINNHNYELYSKNDKDFIKSVIFALINVFNFKPCINTNQFFKNGFVEAKVIFCCDIINIIVKEHEKLEKKALSSASNLNKRKNNNSNNKYSCKSNNYFISDKNQNKVVNSSSSKNEKNKLTSASEFNNNDLSISLNDNESDLKEPIAYDSSNLKNNNIMSDCNLTNYKESINSIKYIGNDNTQIEQNLVYNNCNNHKQDSSKDSNILQQSNEFKDNQIEELVDIINSLAYSVKDMTSKVDIFKKDINSNLSKIENELNNLKLNYSKLEAENNLLKNEIFIINNKFLNKDIIINNKNSNKKNNLQNKYNYNSNSDKENNDLYNEELQEDGRLFSFSQNKFIEKSNINNSDNNNYSSCMKNIQINFDNNNKNLENNFNNSNILDSNKDNYVLNEIADYEKKPIGVKDKININDFNRADSTKKSNICNKNNKINKSEYYERLDKLEQHFKATSDLINNFAIK